MVIVAVLFSRLNEVETSMKVVKGVAYLKETVHSIQRRRREKKGTVDPWRWLIEIGRASCRERVFLSV